MQSVSMTPLTSGSFALVCLVSPLVVGRVERERTVVGRMLEGGVEIGRTEIKLLPNLSGVMLEWRWRGGILCCQNHQQHVFKTTQKIYQTYHMNRNNVNLFFCMVSPSLIGRVDRERTIVGRMLKGWVKIVRTEITEFIWNCVGVTDDTQEVCVGATISMWSYTLTSHFVGSEWH